MGTLIFFGSHMAFVFSLVALFIAFMSADIYENGYSETLWDLIFIGLNYFWSKKA